MDNQEEQKPKKEQEENKSQKKDENAPTDEEIKAEKEKLEALLKSIKALEESKRNQGKKPNRKRNIIAIEFGSVFHHNVLLNFLGYFMLNLTVIYTVLTVFDFGKFSSLLAVLLFAFSYTIFETMFRTYILVNHFKWVLKSFGFIFYFGYLTLFYILSTYMFNSSVQIYDEVSIVAFVALFILMRYIFTKLLRQFVFMK